METDVNSSIAISRRKIDKPSFILVQFANSDRAFITKELLLKTGSTSYLTTARSEAVVHYNTAFSPIMAIKMSDFIKETPLENVVYMLLVAEVLWCIYRT